jgi:hypothetical protein
MIVDRARNHVDLGLWHARSALSRCEIKLPAFLYGEDGPPVASYRLEIAMRTSFAGDVEYDFSWYLLSAPLFPVCRRHVIGSRLHRRRPP